MNLRHEWKYIINPSELLVLRQRLRAMMQPDEHAVNGTYEIRSLYFDNLSDQALREKLDGVNKREKFRLRYYNRDPSMIRLEKKSKYNGLCSKESAILNPEETQALLNGNSDFMAQDSRPLITEFYAKSAFRQLRPKTIVDYTREPYLFPAGNVRITLDYDIRTGLLCTDFLNPASATILAGDAPIILEIKWDAYLPDIIRDIVQLKEQRSCAFSKYAACRIYG